MGIKELPFIVQMANVGNEIYRMKRWQHNKLYFESSFKRTLDLLIQVIEDEKNRKYSRLKELLRLKTLLIDAYYGGKEHQTQIDDLIKYFDLFTKLYNNTIISK